ARRLWPRRCAGYCRSPPHAPGSLERKPPAARLLLVRRRNRGEVGAAVLLPGVLVVSGGPRLLRAEADGEELRGFRTQLGEVAFGGVRAALAEGEVVLLGAALVAVAFDADLEIGVAGEHVADRRELLARFRGQRRRVELE